MNDNTPLNLEFVNACYKEVQGTSMLRDATNGTQNVGPLYRVGNDPTTNVLKDSLFLEKAVESCIEVFRNPNIKELDKATWLMMALISAVKFGLYVQRRHQALGGNIL